MTELAHVDLTDPELYRDGVPHDVFTELRGAGAVHPHSAAIDRPGIPPLPFWSVVRHAEIQRMNRDWETFSPLDGPPLEPNDDMRGRTLLTMDPPDHTTMRRLITAGFTPRMIAKLEQHIAARTTRVLRAVEDGPCDFVRDVAYQVPMHLIADIVGIPEDERAWVFERADLLLRTSDPCYGFTDADRLELQIELFEYAQRLTASKREHPADDVWTLLADELDGYELEMFFLILTLAGSETTRNAISQGLLALLDAPEQLAELRSDPTLVVSAADEAIRWASPVLYFARTATRDVDVDGHTIRAGDRVVLWYPSGNRDDRVFDDPFRFDIRRTPNPHLSFGGGGPHFCLGANLAKKEVQVVLGAIAAGYDVELLGPPVWAGSGPVHNVGLAVNALPVRLSPRR